MEIWDGYYKDGTLANVDLIRGNAIPDGLFHLVCEVLVRHIDGDYLLMQRDFMKPNYGGYFEATAGGSALKGEDTISCVYFNFLCITDCDKASITLQDGETIAYRWVNETEFITFINSTEIIAAQKQRYLQYFEGKGYIRK